MGQCLDFASKAKHKIVIQSKGTTLSATGGQSDTWTTVNTVWAIIEPSSGNEVFASQQLQSRVTHKIIIHYLSSLADTSVTGSYRCLLDSIRVLNIQYVRNLHYDLITEGKAFQVLYCEENGAGIA